MAGDSPESEAFLNHDRRDGLVPRAPDARHSQFETGDRAGSFNDCRAVENLRLRSCGINGHGAAEWINAPCELSAVGDPFLHLGVEFREHIAWGKDFD